MSVQVDVLRSQQFTAGLFHLSQQKGSMLAPFVRKEKVKGKSAFFDRIGAVSAQLRTTRHADTPQIDTPHSRRMLTLADYEWADLIDDQDKIRMLHSPESDYMKAAMNAMGRSMDDVIIAAAIGSAATGEAGASSQALGTGQRVQAVAAAAASNLNVLALRKAKYLLDAGKVPGSDKRYIAINASALENLLSQTEVTSSDYNAVKALVQGDIDTFMGFKFILTEQLVAPSVAFSFNTTTGLYNGAGSSSTLASSKSMIAWAEGGLILGIGENPVGKISERDDKGYSTQAYARMSLGAVRMEEARVVEILCAQ